MDGKWWGVGKVESFCIAIWLQIKVIQPCSGLFEPFWRISPKHSIWSKIMFTFSLNFILNWKHIGELNVVFYLDQYLFRSFLWTFIIDVISKRTNLPFFRNKKCEVHYVMWEVCLYIEYIFGGIASSSNLSTDFSLRIITNSKCFIDQLAFSQSILLYVTSNWGRMFLMLLKRMVQNGTDSKYLAANTVYKFQIVYAKW